MTGPQTPAHATHMLVILTTKGRTLAGGSSRESRIVSAYSPVPPTPWIVLKIMSCTAVCASPEAKEKHVKMKKDIKITALRPKTSESLDTKTENAISASVYASAAQIVFL